MTRVFKVAKVKNDGTPNRARAEIEAFCVNLGIDCDILDLDKEWNILVHPPADNDATITRFALFLDSLEQRVVKDVNNIDLG